MQREVFSFYQFH